MKTLAIVGFFLLCNCGLRAVKADDGCWVSKICENTATPTWTKLTDNEQNADSQECNGEITAKLDDLTGRMDHLDRAIQDLTLEIQAGCTNHGGEVTSPSPVATPAPNVPCQVKYNGVCYWTELFDASVVNYAVAVSVCAGNGSVPAFIVDERHYNAILQLVRQKTTWNPWTEVWTAARYNSSAGTVDTVGSVTPFIHWAANQPFVVHGESHVSLKVWNYDSDEEGMCNSGDSDMLIGVICQA